MKLKYPYTLDESYDWDRTKSFAILHTKHIETEYGDVSAFKLIDVFTQSQETFYYADSNNILDYLLSQCIGEDETLVMGDLGVAKIAGVTIWRRLGTSRMTIYKNGKYYRSYNLSDFSPYALEDLDTICDFVMGIAHWCKRNNLVLKGLGSLPSIARSNILKDCYEEFRAVYGVGEEALSMFSKSIIGGRQECLQLGVVDALHYDIEKAHLSILEDCPSLVDTVTVIGSDYNPDALYGTYLVRVRNSKKDRFPYIPYKKHGVWYPIKGRFEQQLPKPYIDLLVKKKRPFEILKSAQIFGERKPAYIKYASGVRTSIKNSPDMLKSRMLYLSAIGSMNTTYYDSKIRGMRAIDNYNPIVYSHILAVQNCLMSELANDSGAEAIRIDAVSTTKEVDIEEFPYNLEYKGGGNSVFLTPILKDKDGSTEYLDLIKEYHNKPYVDFHFQYYPALEECFGGHLGKKSRSMRIFPSGGSRILNAKIGNVGNLLINNYSLLSPSVSDIPNLIDIRKAEQERDKWLIRHLPVETIST